MPLCDLRRPPVHSTRVGCRPVPQAGRSSTSGEVVRHDVEGDDADVSVSLEADVAVVTLRRPPHNLLTVPSLRSLADAVEDLPSVARAAVLCSEGRSFCAGADFRAGNAPDPTDSEGFRALTGAFYAEASRVFGSPVPLVAAVQGAAVGAGFGLALACDLRVCGERGWFQANFVRLGIHPGFGLTFTLPRLVGAGRATELFLTGRRVGADEAARIGIAEALVAEGEEVRCALDLAREIASGAPLAVKATRRTLRSRLVEEASAAMDHELDEQTTLAGTADAVAGVRAMLQGGKTRFEGQ
jgi:2-(1,2-epoxy-1,2-dihydrophenyl)acetyl-CoA isomerase